MIKRLALAACAGWLGGFLGNAALGALFSSPWIRAVLYNPALQSQLFIDITPQRNIALSVAGLIVLSGLHGIVFAQVSPSLPGATWLTKGAVFGVAIWALYWLFQEWFIYITLLKEPVALALLELAILLAGSLVEGLTIAWVLRRRGSSN